MELRKVTVGVVHVSGPTDGGAVVVLPGSARSVDDYAEVCERLHNSGLQTFVLESIGGVGHEALIGALDELSLRWVHLVGDDDGADLAWQVAARHFGRVSSLVVAGHAHPAVAGADGTVLDATCPAVEVATTVVLGRGDNRAQAYATGRHAYSEYRVVELDEVDSVPSQAAAELATEIVLRSNPW
ncbi:alpha/beta hydrolase [Speluncibacter jeojiensis]|uniref:Alpha/beta hydrolase n=1 Tax=Speluncibacter jeojiensis TaxID=2710754 RepID=A0A9X4RD99_9ACTN|nr:alpha/beta hydrolase [Corynebacteriales bacterium D3-21]